MSSAAEEGVAAELAEADICCANCGAAEIDDIKLEECNECDLVKYCSEKCREDHRERHEEECTRRAKELHDRELFTQPDGTHEGECPLCFLPMPIDQQKSLFHTCCSNRICQGCLYANFMTNGDHLCPFCRASSKDKEESRKRLMKRIKAKDPAALCHMGQECFNEGDYDDAFEYLTKAAKLGDADAHYRLGCMYWKGNGVGMDEEKMVYHWEQAAIGSHPHARHNLGCYEEEVDNIERAVKHYIIAAKVGHEKSMELLWGYYSAGNITKEGLDSTLRAHQAALVATKSSQRKKAEELFQRLQSRRR